MKACKMAELQNKLPSGWDIRFDASTGRYYYLNHYTKTTTWDDPRASKPRHSLPGEHIQLQHGSPEFRRNYVYPSQITPIPAFQIPNNYSPKTIRIQDMVSSLKNSPKSLTRINETSLMNDETEQSVAKIGAMFPTVSDTHIRLLLKKYLNREALVISALQVEKHPITTPGPYATPPAARNIIPATVLATPPLSVRFDSRGGSPILRPPSGCSSSIYASEFAYRNSPKPPHSPKLKLRYMKSIFPKAEETIILEVLSCNDNNIQKASENLREMGYEKREISKTVQQTTPALQRDQKPKEQEPPKTFEPIKMKSPETKRRIAALLGERYKNVPSQVVTFALESVDYDEDRADQILQTMDQEEDIKDVTDAEEIENKTGESTNMLTVEVKPSQSRQSIKNILKTDKSEYSLKELNSFSRVIEQNATEKRQIYQSPNLLNTNGANRSLVKGANRELLLEDYIKWHGPNANLHRGPRTNLSKGSDASLLISKSYQPCGPNKDLIKGSQYLAKGSIFSKFKNLRTEESRGK